MDHGLHQLGCARGGNSGEYNRGFRARQGGIGLVAAAALGRGTSRAPLSQSRNASQWIAAMILNVTSGSAENARNNPAGSGRGAGR